jgi:hypothetical protein
MYCVDDAFSAVCSFSWNINKLKSIYILKWKNFQNYDTQAACDVKILR